MLQRKIHTCKYYIEQGRHAWIDDKYKIIAIFTIYIKMRIRIRLYLQSNYSVVHMNGNGHS